ncbi:MAG: exopolysaccharide biosynthesis polyprenyl glycosylphosphotransferase [Acidobacteria bacterium]|nr:exopolysaccharide biosynthesis polyprenyl glycosylphosphotransferase [Acidobacteriota bacterium]
MLVSWSDFMEGCCRVLALVAGLSRPGQQACWGRPMFVQCDDWGQFVSLAQSGFVTASPFRGRAHRLVVLSSETERLSPFIATGANRRIEVVRLIRLGENVPHEHLASSLSPQELNRDGISGIVIASGHQHLLPSGLLLDCQLKGIEVFKESSFWEAQRGYVDIDDPDQRAEIASNGLEFERFYGIRRRVFELLLAGSMLLAALPLMLLVAVLIKIDSRGPIMYRQERVGLGGRRFMLYKFRSMHTNAEADGLPQWATIGDPRVTRVGRFIRYARIDELPQLLNVLRGNMSLVGPRPERPYFVEQLAAAIPLYTLRHSIKPGITGWAQINASYGASIEDARLKLKYDLYYLKYRSFVLDLRILFRTLRVVLFQEGAR